MKEAYINAKILDPEKNKEFIGDIIIEKDRIVEVKPVRDFKNHYDRKFI